MEGNFVGNKRDVTRLILIGAAALLLGWVFWTGYRIGLQTERGALIAGIWYHVGHGIVATPLLAAYLWYRVALKNTPKHYAVFSVLCVATIFLMLSGPVVVWSYGSDLKVFNWFVVPNPIGKLPVIHDPFEVAHKYVALVLPGLVVLDLLWIFVRRILSEDANS